MLNIGKIKKSRLSRVVKIVWIIAISIALIWVGFKFQPQLQFYFSNLDWKWLALILGVELVRRLIGAMRWSVITNFVVAAPPMHKIFIHMRHFFFSNLAVYIPAGFVWSSLLRFQLNKAAGISFKNTAAAYITDAVIMLVVSCALGAYCIFYIVTGDILLSVLAVTLSLVCVVVVTQPVVMEYFIRKVREGYSYPLTQLQAIFLIALSMTAKILSGIALCVGFLAFGESLDPASVLYIISLFSIAWVIGIFSWMPAGIGIRDGVLVWGLSGFSEIALIVAVVALSRIVSFFPDIFWGLVSLLTHKMQLRSAPDEQ